MKQLDKAYCKDIFEDNTNYVASERIKADFLKVHSRALDIDNIVDNFIFQEL
jgi:hypothetical protein